MKGSGIAHRNGYTQADIDHALTIVALHAGGTQKAADYLAEHGRPISQQTLSNWKHHPDGRYDRVCTQVSPQIAERVAQMSEAVVLKATEVEHALLDALVAQKDQLKPAELSTAARNVTTTKALNMDKIINPIRGRPSHITEHRTATELIHSLEDLAGLPQPDTVNSTAEEITQ